MDHRYGLLDTGDGRMNKTLLVKFIIQPRRKLNSCKSIGFVRLLPGHYGTGDQALKRQR
jgi:hypothetical protein